MHFLRSSLLALIALVGLVAADVPLAGSRQGTAASSELRPAGPLNNPALPERQMTSERRTRHEQLLREPTSRTSAATTNDRTERTERKESERMTDRNQQLADAEDVELVAEEDEFEVEGFHGHGHGYGHGYGGYGGKKGYHYAPKQVYSYKKPKVVEVVYVEAKKPHISHGKKGGYGGYGY